MFHRFSFELNLSAIDCQTVSISYEVWSDERYSSLESCINYSNSNTALSVVKLTQAEEWNTNCYLKKVFNIKYAVNVPTHHKMARQPTPCFRWKLEFIEAASFVYYAILFRN